VAGNGLARRKAVGYQGRVHQGRDTEFYMRKGFRVVAIEANPFLVENLRDRFRPFLPGSVDRVGLSRVPPAKRRGVRRGLPVHRRYECL
jgi:hypothetical protein